MSVENRWDVTVDVEWRNADSTRSIVLGGFTLRDLSDFAAWLEEMLTKTLEEVT